VCRMAVSLFFLCWSVLPAQVVFSALPKDLQLYARDSDDSAVVEVAGTVLEAGYSEILVAIAREGQPHSSETQLLEYSGGAAPFSLKLKIHAELANYAVSVLLDNDTIAQADSVVCGDAFAITGQSNSICVLMDPKEGFAHWQNPWVRSFGDAMWRNEESTPSYVTDPLPMIADTFWGVAQSRSPGIPGSHCYVGVWGLRMAEVLMESAQVPIAVINGGRSGGQIELFVPDSTNPDTLFGNAGLFGRLKYRVGKARLAHKLKALFWNQGEADAGSDLRYQTYAATFDKLYQAWKDVFGFKHCYLFQLHPSGSGSSNNEVIREIQRRIPGQYADVAAIPEIGLTGHVLAHFTPSGYLQMGQWVGDLLAHDFYGSNKEGVVPPDVLRAWYRSEAHDEIVIEFSQPVIWQNDSLGRFLKDYFYLLDTSQIISEGVSDFYHTELHGDSMVVDSGYVLDRTRIVLRLKEASNASYVSYITNGIYHDADTVIPYDDGPCIKSTLGVGAFTFLEVPILNEAPATTTERQVENHDFSISASPNPFNPSTVITISGLNALHSDIFKGCAIGVYSIQGVLLRHFQISNTGNRAIVFDANGLTSGTYIIKAMGNGRVFTKRITLIK